MIDIFTPFSFKGLTFQNRSMRSATAERMADDLTGHPHELYQLHYQNLAQGDIGLIITGHMYVDRSGKCHPEMTAIDHDEVIPLLSTVTNLVHQTKSKIIPQINFGGLQCSKEVNTLNLSPSEYQNHGESTAHNREITAKELENLIQSFAKAARRVQLSGFDGVMLHAAHGYFISQMLSPAVNQRNDRCGGSFQNRLRFLQEVTSAIRAEVGESFPLLIKLGLKDGVPGGLTLDDGIHVISTLESMGIDAVEISGGLQYNSMDTIRKPEEEAYFRTWAIKAREATNLPLFLVGGFRSLAIMNSILDEGVADMISLCRPLICEPDLIRKFSKGLKTKADCISCNRCFAQKMNEGTRCQWKEDHRNP